MKFLNDEIYAVYKNIAHAGILENQSGDIRTGTAGVLGQGDFVQFQIHIVDQHIEHARYKVHGTAATIACCELLARTVTTLPIKEAATLDPQVLIQQLHLSRQRQTSALLAVNALRAAIGVC